MLLYDCIPKNSESVWGIEKKYKNQIQLLCANSDPMGTIVLVIYICGESETAGDADRAALVL